MDQSASRPSTMFGGMKPRTLSDEILRELVQTPLDGGEVERRARAAIVGGRNRGTLNYAIRAKCLDCCCWQPSEVLQCSAVHCPLWTFRMGDNPFRKRRELSKDQIAALRGALKEEAA